MEYSNDLKAFFEKHNKLKYIFFGGKGGVGKTICAGATACWLAKSGKRVLLASTNPVHSLSSMLEQNVFGKETTVAGVPNLYALEIDTKDTITKSKNEIREKINWFLKFADVTITSENFIESAVMNPAFEESAMFENMIELIFANKYDIYVFDTAPTANARRLLGMSKIYALWVDKMLKSRDDARSLKELLSFSNQKDNDPLMDYLIGLKKKMEYSKLLLTDIELTAFFFITLPESLPIAVISRFIRWFKDFGIPVGGIIINGVIEHNNINSDYVDFVNNRIKMQSKYINEIFQKFGKNNIRAIITLFESEIKGVQMLSTAAESIFV